MDHETRQLVYVTGPYSARTLEEEEANIRRAVDIGRVVFQKGYYPIVPHVLV